MAKTTLKLTDMDDSTVEVSQPIRDWQQLLLRVTDMDDTPAGAYLSITDAAALYEYLGAWLKEQS